MATSRTTSKRKTASKAASAKRRPTSAETTTGSASSAGPVPTPDAPPVIVAETRPESAAPELKKPELIDEVIKRADMRKKFAKPVVEAMLEVLGEALAEGRELNLPPMGKVKLNRMRDGAHARIIVAKIRQPKQGGNLLAIDEGAEPDTDVKDAVAQRSE